MIEGSWEVCHDLPALGTFVGSYVAARWWSDVPNAAGQSVNTRGAHATGTNGVWLGPRLCENQPLLCLY